MQKLAVERVLTGLVWVGLIGVILLTLNSPGTSDMGIWLSWADNVDRQGLVNGFAANQADYPPLTSAILLGAVRLGEQVDVRPFVAIKLSIGLFLGLTTLAFWRWTRDLRAAVWMFLALLLNSMLLAYVDIYVAPALVLALWALKEGRLGLFSLCYTAACLTKWQPLIIAPFLLVYALGRRERRPALGATLLGLGLPAAALLGASLLIFHWGPVWQAFKASLGHQYLSGNALNANWIQTHLIRVFSPEAFGGLAEGRADLIITGDTRYTLIPRLVFALFYLAGLGLFLRRREKTFAGMLTFALLGFLAYFTFNPGVHENHLFVPAILAAALAFWAPERRLEMLIVALMFNINMYVFYGSSGPGLEFDRVIFHQVDMALPLACINVLFFLYLGAKEMLNAE